MIRRAPPLRNQDGEPLGKPGRHPPNHVNHPVCGAQGRQPLHPYKLPYHSGIHHGVQLLEHIPQHQRKGKKENQLRRASDSHIFRIAQTIPSFLRALSVIGRDKAARALLSRSRQGEGIPLGFPPF